jgi:hypothetical protein
LASPLQPPPRSTEVAHATAPCITTHRITLLPLSDLDAATGHHRAPYRLSQGPLRIIERATGNAAACLRGRWGNAAARPRGCRGGAVALKAAGEHRSAAVGATYVGARVVAGRSAHLSPLTTPFTEERERCHEGERGRGGRRREGTSPRSHRSPPPRAVVTVSPLSSFIGRETGTNRDRDEAAAHSSFRRHGEGDAPVRRIRHR